MKIEAKLIARTYQVDGRRIPIPVGCSDIDYDSKILAGKAAGVCYMPDDYFSNGFEDEEKNLKRANMTAENGHYSVWEHMSVTLLLKLPKIMAMTLNNLKYYAASEKSGRYTKMEDENKLCNEKYDKWLSIFKSLIKASYGDILSEKDIEKKAQENARYMLSVFTPTTEIYTAPYGRLVLLVQYLLIASENFTTFSSTTFEINYRNACKELAEEICKAIDVDIDDLPLKEIKNIKYPLFLPNNYRREIGIVLPEKKNYFGDTYTVTYNGSFAQLAQAQRHRTLDYSISLIEKKFGNGEYFYIPEILNKRLADEWNKDLVELYNNDIMPQGRLVKITEQGTVENFVLKCTERLCNKAQLEIAIQTAKTFNEYFSKTKSDYAREYLLPWSSCYGNYLVNRRCACGFICKNPDVLCNNKIFFTDNKDI